MVRGVTVRVLNSLLVLFASSVLIFLLVSLAGDPLAEMRQQDPPVAESVIAAEEHRLGLDLPLPQRYADWITGVVARGDFGQSVSPTLDIGAELAERVVVTLRLVITAMVLAIVLAVLAGLVSGLKQGRVPDLTLTFGSFVLLSLPSFWMAVLLKQGGIWINKSTGYRIFYTVGYQSVPPIKGFWPHLADLAGHLILPTIVLILVHLASWTRYQRTATIKELDADHVKYAILRGLPHGVVLRSHVIRPSLIPLITILGLELPGLFSGAIITETVFQWNGMGALLLDALRRSDVNTVLGWLLVSASAVVFFNLLTDILYRFVDPRMRRGSHV
ncbi:MAG: ABC transporter permease [Propionibacteriaceae bacterium]|jgi:peptide/nickel transport system permease protein|nr:ABC transporter permease [Propionibacteriaceae bacterium]